MATGVVLACDIDLSESTDAFVDDDVEFVVDDDDSGGVVNVVDEFSVFDVEVVVVVVVVGIDGCCVEIFIGASVDVEIAGGGNKACDVSVLFPFSFDEGSSFMLFWFGG